MIIYATNGTTEFNPDLSVKAMLGLSLGIVFAIVSFVFPKYRISLYLPIISLFFENRPQGDVIVEAKEGENA